MIACLMQFDYPARFNGVYSICIDFFEIFCFMQTFFCKLQIHMYNKNRMS